ncbi:MAG: C39 family peptidase [Pseudomonadota bacterium]
MTHEEGGSAGVGPAGDGSSDGNRATLLARAQSLYDLGRCVQAYEAARELGPLNRWTGAEGRLLAGRIASNVGGIRLGRVLTSLAWRLEPLNLRMAGFHARNIGETRGPYACLRFMAAREHLLEAATDEDRCDWLVQLAELYSRFRDWDRSDALFDQAEAVGVGLRPWHRVERAAALENQDCLDAARAALDQCLADHPWYRPAVQMKAHLHELSGEIEAAIALLDAGLAHIESANMAYALFRLQVKHTPGADLSASIERLEQLSIVDDTMLKRSFVALKCDYAIGRRDRAMAIEMARECQHGYYENLLERLEAKDAIDDPVELPVPFVRQQHRTCGPATLDALSQFLGHDADQVEIIEQIWFDGTSDYLERSWAEAQGLAVREFRLTWESARALIDRGIPFAVATVEATSAHMQAVVGYHPTTETLTLRDPTDAFPVQMLAGAGLEYYAATGPRAMVFLPVSESARLDGLELPEAELFDMRYEFASALEAHDRMTAGVLLESLRAAPGAERLTLLAERTLAHYDGDSASQAQAMERLRALFPEDRKVAVWHESALEALDLREERIGALEALVSDPACDPSHIQSLAGLLRDDAREWPRVRRLLKGLLARMPMDSENYLQLAAVEWQEGQYDTALTLHRIAACLGDLQPRYVTPFWRASYMRGQTGEALEFLERRVERFGQLGPRPAIELARAYEQIDRDADVQQTLSNALAARPDDAELSLHLADYLARTGRGERAQELLEEARGRTHEADWLLTAIAVAEYLGDREASYRHALRHHELLPRNVNTVRGAYRALLEFHGPEAALTWLREQQQRFAHDRDIHAFLVEELADGNQDERLSAVDALVANHPSDTWALRERALVLSRMGRAAAALDASDQALQFGPAQAASHLIKGFVLLRDGAIADARNCFKQALALDIDCGDGISYLFRSSQNASERRDAMHFVQSELERQVVLGDGLMEFQNVAAEYVDAEELLTLMRQGYGARPDLWQSSVALTRQLRQMSHLDEALRLSEAAVRRFATLPVVWREHGLVLRACGDTSRERQALGQALRINAHYLPAVRTLADSYEMTAEIAAARELVEGALQRSPLDAGLHAYRADYAERGGDLKLAMAAVLRAIELSPDYNWAWNTLERWAEEAGDADLPRRTAEALTRKYPGIANSFWRLAREQEDPETRLDSLRRALSLDARHLPSHELRVEILVDAERYDEALAAVDDPVWAGSPPREVRIYKAWLERRRGDSEAGYAELEALLAEEPNFETALYLHADWLEMDERLIESRDACQRLVEFSPMSARAHAYHGDALLKTEEDADALVAFRRACELQPEYSFAQRNRFNLALRAGEIAEAQTCLDVWKLHDSSAYVAYSGVRLGCERKDGGAAAFEIRRLATLADDDDEILSAAFELYAEVAGPDAAGALLTELIDDETSGRAVGWCWAERVGSARDWQAELERLNVLMARGPVGLGAAVHYLRALGQGGDPTWADRFIGQHRPALRRDIGTWAAVTSMYRDRNVPAAALEWADDWRERDDAGASDLHPLALACWETGDWRAALDVHERALGMTPDYVRPYHALLASLACAYAGDDKAARHWLQETGDTELTDYYEAARGIAEVLVMVAFASDASFSARACYARLRAARKRNSIPNDEMFRRWWLLGVARTAERLAAPWPLFAKRIWVRIRS